MNSIVYLDNNATTMMPTRVKQTWLEWSNMGNPSSGYACAKQCRNMMAEFGSVLTKHKCIFTSGASEANSTAIQSICAAVREYGRIPHVIVSEYEHKSALLCVESLEERKLITVTKIAPDRNGVITVESVEAVLRARVCDLVIVMQSNNELGAINDVEAIAQICHKYGAVMHADIVQMFGKMPCPMQHVDSCAVSFHKLHGPMGVGAWFLREELRSGYNLQPMIFGTQNDGMRGGTENLPGIAAAYSGYKHTMHNRADKNAKLIRMRMGVIKSLQSRYETYDYADWTDDTIIQKPCAIVCFGTRTRVQPGCVFLSVILRDRRACNTELKKSLERRGIIVSVGSACNTASKYASHVLTAMRACARVRAGALRITFGDDSTDVMLERFLDAFDEAIVENIEREKE